MSRPILAALLLAAACSGSLAGWGEKAPRISPEPAPGYNSQGAERPLRERTLQQGESGATNY